MSGIYFVHTDVYTQCWIGVSMHCEKRMNFVKKILQDDTAQCYYIPTDMSTAKEVHKAIRFSLREYAVDNGNWYNLESLQVGRFIQQVKQHVDLCSFPPYEDSDYDAPDPKRKRI